LVAVLALIASLMLCVACTATQKGAGIGAAVGGVAGAVVGHNTKYGKGTGALVGAAAGGLAGALTGDAIRQNKERQRQNPPRDPNYYNPPPQQRQQPQAPAPSYYPEDVR
jgi:phage tail tape-measure protein